MKIKNYELSFGPSLNSSTNSAVEDLSQDFGFSAQVSFTGAALNGSFKLQASNDNSNWVDVSSSSQAVTALTGSSSVLWNIDAAYYNYVRIAWTNSSGTGTISSCKMVVKGA